MTIDERLEALAMNLELMSHDSETLRESIKGLRALAEKDGENIRGLARIAEMHHAQLESLGGRVSRIEDR